MGDHTDYNAGLVLPCAIDRYVLAGLSQRNDDEIHVLAIDSNNESDSFHLDAPITPHPTQPWSNYIRGVARVLLDRGYTLTGCDIAVTGNIPQGAGLSSSAALVVSVLRALTQASKIQLQAIDLARLAQAVENEFVGCACGIMDQLISVVGRKDYAFAIDCRNLEFTPIRIPPSLSLLIVNSNVQRMLVDGEYNLRRQQCESAAQFLGKSSLRAVEARELEEAQDGMDTILAKRARHVLGENQRVLDLVDALERNNAPSVCRIMASSHLSLRDLFEVTVPEVDLLVNIISNVLGDRGGVRMTGGGFGGSVVALLPHALMNDVENAVAQHYHLGSGVEASIYRTRASHGLSLVE
jgi:galactokinase